MKTKTAWLLPWFVGMSEIVFGASCVWWYAALHNQTSSAVVEGGVSAFILILTMVVTAQVADSQTTTANYVQDAVLLMWFVAMSEVIFGLCCVWTYTWFDGWDVHSSRSGVLVPFIACCIVLVLTMLIVDVAAVDDDDDDDNSRGNE